MLQDAIILVNFLFGAACTCTVQTSAALSMTCVCAELQFCIVMMQQNVKVDSDQKQLNVHCTVDETFSK
jgi:hypothetical protein